MPALDPPHAAKPDFSNGLVSLHATLIFLAIGAFGLSAIAALMFLTEEHDLKFHKLRAIFSLLPPIQRLERVMNILLLCGIALLTAGLFFSPFLVKEKFGVYFKSDPLLDYSIFIWIFYLVLLVARWKFGQRGRRFAWSTLGSFAFIMLTFWGFLLLSPVHLLATAIEERGDMMNELSTVPLLIIDDLGMRKLPAAAAEDLLELVMRRYERASTIITSNLPLEDWRKLFGDTPAVTAFLDRLMHHGHSIEYRGKSYRLHESSQTRAQRKAPTLP